jgi:hypothetical protein
MEKNMKTGRDANQSGVYSSECCGAEIRVATEQMFPRCPLCYELTLWVPVKRNIRQGEQHHQQQHQ